MNNFPALYMKLLLHPLHCQPHTNIVAVPLFGLEVAYTGSNSPLQSWRGHLGREVRLILSEKVPAGLIAYEKSSVGGKSVFGISKSP